MVDFTGRISLDGNALARPVGGWIRQLGGHPPSYEGELTLPRDVGQSLMTRTFRLDIEEGAAARRRPPRVRPPDGAGGVLPGRDPGRGFTPG